MKKDKYIYPAIFEKEGEKFNVSFPDLDIFTYGDSLEDALYMAKDCLGGYLVTLEDLNISIPNPSMPYDITTLNHQFVQLIEVYMPPIRDEEQNKTERRNVTIPKWLNKIVKEKNINCSAVLVSALKNQLGI
jgi:predicted RNase H-like HicB family nuclease